MFSKNLVMSHCATRTVWSPYQAATTDERESRQMRLDDEREQACFDNRISALRLKALNQALAKEMSALMTPIRLVAGGKRYTSEKLLSGGGPAESLFAYPPLPLPQSWPRLNLKRWAGGGRIFIAWTRGCAPFGRLPLATLFPAFRGLCYLIAKLTEIGSESNEL